jgi:hypothetical protein
MTTLFDYAQYKSLKLDEYIVIEEYFDANKSPLAHLFLSKPSYEMTESMKQFMIDVIMGKVSVRRGRPMNYEIDYQIYNFVSGLLDEGFTLTGTKQMNALDLASEEFGIENETLLKRYQRYKRKHES